MSGSIQHSAFDTKDLDASEAYVRQMYVEHDLTIAGDARGPGFSAQHLQIGPVFFARLQHNQPVVLHITPSAAFQPISLTHDPAAYLQADDQRHPFARTGPIVQARDEPYTMSWTSAINGCGIDPDLLRDVALDQLDADQPLSFDFGPALNPTAAAHWTQVSQIVRRVALANLDQPHNDVLALELGRLLAGATLICFPNPSRRGPSGPPPRTTPASLRRAVAFIDDHLDQPITPTQIAEAARVSPRALNETFRRHRDTTPTDYLRRARLAQAHHDLATAEPGDGQTVTAIAARWGFHSPTRFAAIYRDTYNTTPSSTLRQPGPSASRPHRQK